ncbi:MAG: radical SAM protein [Polyangiaceae bacterium]|nr:radical SAM protein [Myxococcales bacterium]MCB9590701.1 radical SAM protein [Polyangiaceae bacterium]
MKLDVLKKDLRFAAGVARKKPFNCLIQVTNRCNMKCSFCDFWPNPAKGNSVDPPEHELSLREFESIADQLDRMGCFLVSIEGGEPLIRKDIVDVVRILSRRHITALFTSGWHMTPEKARELFAAGLTHASVSIDYPDARHDQKRRVAGTRDRAWEAVDMLKAAAPRGGKQVNVMTVILDSNWQSLGELFEQTKQSGVGQQVTLLSTMGTRRVSSAEDRLPPPEAAASLASLWKRYPHVRFFREYFAVMQTFLEFETLRDHDGTLPRAVAEKLPTCRAGAQSFNIDHLGNVSSCIERIGKPVGSIRQHSLETLHGRLVAEAAEIAACQQCWTACRGFQQAIGDGGSVKNWLDMSLRTRTD